MSTVFRSQMPELKHANVMVEFEALGVDALPAILTNNEYMTRMKAMAAMQPGMDFYAELPDSYNLVMNTEHPVVKRMVEEHRQCRHRGSAQRCSRRKVVA